MFFSDDFNGDLSQIKAASWEAIETKIATEDDNDQIWIDSGNLEINHNSNQVFFAFRYTGSGKTANDGTYELDDIRVFEGEN